MGAPKVTDAAIRRAISAAKDSDLSIGAVIVNNIDGTIRIEIQRPESVDEEEKDVQISKPKAWPKR